jgi:hypothetical protein
VYRRSLALESQLNAEQETGRSTVSFSYHSIIQFHEHDEFTCFPQA